MTDQAATTVLNPGGRGAMREMAAFLKQRLTPRVGATVAIWQFEAKTATPLAILFVATLGRWEGALAMGAMMAVYSAVLLFLLDGQQVMDDLREWMRGRAWGRHYLSIAERPGVTGATQRALAVPATIMIYGPFWRAITYHLARVPRSLGHIQFGRQRCGSDFLRARIFQHLRQGLQDLMFSFAGFGGHRFLDSNFR